MDVGNPINPAIDIGQVRGFLGRGVKEACAWFFESFHYFLLHLG